MRKITLISLLLVFGLALNAQNLNASLSFARFHSPELGSYVETYLSVSAAGVKFELLEDGKYQAKVNLLLMFKQGDSIVDYSKTQLSSPAMDDTLQTNYSFIDQQRFFMPNGNYQLEIEFSDASRSEKPSTAKVDILLDFKPDEVQLSDVEFLSSYMKSDKWQINTKNGYDMVPHVSSFFDEHEKQLIFYAEIYQAAKLLGEGSQFLLTTYVANAYDMVMNDDMVIRKKVEAEEVNVILNQFDLSKLASGNYYLFIEVRDKENKIRSANKSFFQVNNADVKFDVELLARISEKTSFVNNFPADSLRHLILSVFPIADPMERAFIKNQLNEVDEHQKRKFLTYFWTKRNELQPKFAWQKYQIEVEKVQSSFGNSFQAGYETDRGRVYLQYGPPNTISDQEFEAGGGRHEGSVPYQIWHYYEIDQYRNGKFVFYNPHLVPNGYTLLHSNVKGEINNPHWQSYLHRNQLENIDAPENDRYDGRSGELYNDPH
ncbi:MAG: hypothetical protein B7C24_12265 [Bacteroidetes bacterium 4572_77]|nr:MAG: hypothetical protein B7C24_12265 [Bacteroidetes bacterium 4572_77]